MILRFRSCSSWIKLKLSHWNVSFRWILFYGKIYETSTVKLSSARTLNLPQVPSAKIKGWKFCRLSYHHRHIIWIPFTSQVAAFSGIENLRGHFSTGKTTSKHCRNLLLTSFQVASKYLRLFEKLFHQGTRSWCWNCFRLEFPKRLGWW